MGKGKGRSKERRPGWAQRFGAGGARLQVLAVHELAPDEEPRRPDVLF